MTDQRRKRSLILAGGGLKVAFQAGVLQVWLDEAELEFDHADGCSGGVFNLAMWCQGMSGTEIAENWRRMNPRRGVQFNWRSYPRLLWLKSIARFDKWRKKVFTEWGLDWDKIRASSRDGTFNVYNFSKQRLEVLGPAQMTEAHLAAAVALPMWFESVPINGDTYIDSVFATDANLIEAVKRGADELWIIWTVSRRGEWREGFIADYFQIIEASANAKLASDLARIQANNNAIASGRQGEFGRTIDVMMLEAEVPLHYLFVFSHARMAAAVNLGVETARRWCTENNVRLRAPTPAIPADPTPTSIEFREQMKGHIGMGQSEPLLGHKVGVDQGTPMVFELTIRIDDVERFVTEPDHDATVAGVVHCSALGGDRPISGGRFNLFIDQAHPSYKRMLYRLYFTDGDGRMLTASGRKEVVDDPGFDLWSDTSTLYTRILTGHVDQAQEAAAEIVAAGIVRIHLVDFMHQLTTFRAYGGSLSDRAAAMGRFGTLFLGKLWDVYARDVISTSPF